MTPTDFNKLLYNFYSTNKRLLPWRQTSDAYKIWISEIMLQQTQVSRVLHKYTEFITNYPTVFDLANESIENILKLWIGLGYNRRALHLHKTALIIVQNYNGIFPKEPLVLKSLPGIGNYTSKAIYVFSTNAPEYFIETNIRTVFIHTLFNKSEYPILDSEILHKIELFIDTQNPRDLYYALMDYGSFLKSKGIKVNHKSAHYKKQSTFKGSKRQARAAIVKYVVNNAPVHINIAQNFLKNVMTYDLDKLITELIAEGFFTLENNVLKNKL